LTGKPKDKYSKVTAAYIKWTNQKC
jgi:hypothetical protein